MTPKAVKKMLNTYPWKLQEIEDKPGKIEKSQRTRQLEGFIKRIHFFFVLLQNTATDEWYKGIKATGNLLSYSLDINFNQGYIMVT